MGENEISGTYKSITVYPSKLNGNVFPPPSKSITHRAFILSSFTKNGKVTNPLQSGDTKATLSSLKEMGAQIRKDENQITFLAKPIHGSTSISCENSGTTLRLLTGICCLFHEPSILTGDDSLNKRPMDPLIRALTELGASVRTENNVAPVFIDSPITENYTSVSGKISSQFISSLLISAALRGNIITKISVVKPVVSKPYIELTLMMLDKCGVQITSEESRKEIVYTIDGSRFQGSSFYIPSDYSSAAFFVVAGIIKNNLITIKNMNRDYPQADAAIIHILRQMGAKISEESNNLICFGSDLNPRDIVISDSPDIFPILCVIASLTPGKITISGASHLKYKETNRILTTVEMLQNMGVNIQGTDDGAIIDSNTILGDCEVNPYGDHRIAMAAAIAATAADKPVTILNPSCVSVSYPNFFSDLEKLGGKIRYHK